MNLFESASGLQSKTSHQPRAGVRLLSLRGLDRRQFPTNDEPVCGQLSEKAVHSTCCSLRVVRRVRRSRLSGNCSFTVPLPFSVHARSPPKAPAFSAPGSEPPPRMRVSSTAPASIQSSSEHRERAHRRGSDGATSSLPPDSHIRSDLTHGEAGFTLYIRKRKAE
jgi:hypothetical protein